ncbi:MAG TPA: DUF5060 domain-containing protein [Tepidisphaeraceae bacterium]|nr:DUF5060 domain-containing protein [Tepidisphaeraceae bacterium]
MTLKKVQCALAAVVFMLIHSGVRADEAITLHRRSDGPVAAYQRVELEVGLDRHYANPFDPDEIAVDAQIVSPAGKAISLPAFWGKNYPATFPEAGKQAAFKPDSPSFRVRFCPTSAGRWKISVTAKDQTGARSSSPIEIDVAPSASRGFIRLSSVNHQYLQFDSGAAYFPVGLNIAWPDGKNPAQYVGWFKSFSENGGNFARVWMCHPPVMIESERSGLGKYDLANAGYFDDLLELAEQNGIDLMLTFNNHRELLNRDMWGPAGWPTSPYNAANGGPATRPVDFFTDEVARKFFKQRLRYFIARYSSFTNMMCWELFNEQELARIHNLPDSWVAEMADYLHANDPYNHLVSTSSDVPESVWKLDGMSISQGHIYGDGEVVDLVTPIVAAVKRHAQFDKPYLLAEFGISYKGPDTQYDPHNTATSLHNSLWAATMSGACGTAAYWWWDNYIGPNNLWPVYQGISKFAASVDWAKRHFSPIELPPPTRAGNKPETFSDLVLPSAGRWGKADSVPINIAPSGQASAALPHYYYGPDKQELRTATTLYVELKKAGDMTLHINTVSDHATLHINVDDNSIADFTFDAQPGGADQESTKMTEEPPQVYQAVFNKDRTVPLAAGKHKIVIDNYAGDWVTVDRITFANAKSSKSADLNALALQDASAGETLVWLFDGTSNWQTDRDGLPHREIDSVSLSIPIARAGDFEASWWDTRTGSIIRRDQVQARDGMLLLITPKFSRDVAVRITAR